MRPSSSSHLWSEGNGKNETKTLESDNDVGDDEPGGHESSRLNLESLVCDLGLNLGIVGLNTLSFGDWDDGAAGASGS